MDAKKIITPECRLSFPHLFVPRPGPSGGEPKFSCALIFEEGTDPKPFQSAIIAAAREKWGDNAVAMFKAGKLKSPLRTDWEDKGYPENSFFLNCSSKEQPGLVYPYADPVTGKPQIVTDPKVFYPGAYVRASLRAFAYDNSGNKGVSFGLNNLQFIRDGSRLDNRVSATNDFDVLMERDLADIGGGDEGEASAAELNDILGIGG